ncbi:luciferin 4-monooxygenase-like [Athalia rosae]|uniref:luciferin 4-monooxygenase-like n=1 Tax=Athalia rosae TaxID=37344 RepID=UPI002033DC7D|nr:luciferin 4-monooxygenase-like [Athalia rosae]
MPSCLSCLVPGQTRRRDEEDDDDGSKKILETPLHPDAVVPPDNVSAGEYIFEILKGKPTHVGQIDSLTDAEDTYGQMLERSVRTALWLRSRGIESGDVVALCTHNHFDTVTPILASLYCGSTAAPWDPGMNCQEIKHMVSISRPRYVFCNEESACTVLVALKECKNDAEVVVFGHHSGCASFADVLKPFAAEDIDEFECSKIDERSEVALIVCSSGSTGLPKGVEHTHRTIMIQFGIVKLLNLRNRTSAVFSSLYWISGVIGVLVCIAGDMRKVIVPVVDEDICARVIEKYRITWALMGTSVLVRLIYSGALEKYDVSSLKTITGGGGVVSLEAFAKLRAILPNALITLGYGMTELGGAATFQLVESERNSCGKPIYGVSCKILDTSTGGILGAGEVGEICWKSPCLMKGYRNNPEETADMIDAEGWLHSGDIGYYDEDGSIYIVDRSKEMIKCRGNQIAPAELEGIIARHPGVQDCAVVGKPDKIDVERPVAFVVRRRGDPTTVTEEEIVRLVASQVSERKQLRGGVRFLDALPVSPSGKTKRAVLRNMLLKEI